MSKAIEGAAMLAGAVGMGVAAFLDPALVASPLFDKAFAALVMGGISMEAAAVASALTTNRGMAITTRQSAAARQVIYGQQRVGGVEIYRSTTGSSHDQFNYVIVLAGHECDSIVNLYLDGRQVHWVEGSTGNSTRNGVNFGGHCDQGTYTGPNGQQYSFGGGHGGYHVYCEARYGDQADGDVIGSLTANDGNWAASSAGSPYVGGCCYVYLKIEYDQSVFPGEPEIRFTVNGKNNIYDPRTGTSGFTTNWALICADVITDSVFGLGDNTVNQDQLIAAANVCDEQVTLVSGTTGATTEARYTTNYHTDTTAAPGDILSTMMVGAAGRLSRIGGEWYIWPAYWQGPSFTFDDNALTGPIQWAPYRSFRDLFNRVNGTYIAPTYPYNVTGDLYDANGFYNGQIQNNFPFAWQPTNYPQYACDVLHGYASDQYLTADGGYQLPLELAFSTVISVAQAQRVAKINLMRNRQQGSGSFPMNLAAWQMQPLDVMQFTFPYMGWAEKSLEIVGVGFQVADSASGDGAQSVRCSMQVQETDASVYEWSTTEELTVYNIPATPTQSPLTPAPPTGMTLTSGASTAIQNLDGTTTLRIEVQWNTPLDVRVTQIQVQYAAVTNPSLWIDAGLVDAGNTLTYITGVIGGAAYNVRIRSVRPNGTFSVWEEIDGYTVSMTLSVVGILSLAPGTLVADAFSDGTADIIVSGFTAIIGNASVAVLPGGPVTISGLSQQTLYWVYYIDPNFTGGAVTPIATTNSADFLNKVGYFLIDSKVTPYCSSTGTTSSTRYSPSNYSDTGSRTTSSPASAYDGNSSTYAVVSGASTWDPGSGPIEGGTGGSGGSRVGAARTTFGSCLWEDFPSSVSSTTTTLSVIAGCSAGGATATLIAMVGATSTTLLSATSLTATATYTLTVPSGTDLSTVSVQATVTPTEATADSDTSFGSLSVYEIYIQ